MGIKGNSFKVFLIDIWSEITSFLRECLSIENIKIPKVLIKDIWVIISFFLNIKEPELEILDIRDTGYIDWVNYAINTFRGQVLQTFFKYSLYVAKILNLPQNKRMAPEVKKKLEALLNPEIDSVEIVRAMISFHLYDIFYLDKKWASEKIALIFPEDNIKLWSIAWESYISYNRLHGKIYQLLRNHYKIAIDKLMSPLISNKALENLAFHVILIYIHKIEDIDEDSVFTLFFANASPELRSKAMWFTIKVYDNSVNTEDQEKILDRILAIWEYRIKEVKKNKNLTSEEKYKEFHWYGLLFEKLDIRSLHLELLVDVLDITEGNIDVFTNFILEVLKDYIEIDPYKVFSAIEKLLKGDVSVWLYVNTENKIINIINLVNDIYDVQDFKDEVKLIADLLTQKGFFKIRELDFFNDLGN